MIKKLSVLLLAGCAGFGQSATQKMVDLSVLVAGAIQKDGKAQAAWVGGGFVLDPKHVATSISCCGKAEGGEQMTPVVIFGDDSFVAKKVWDGAGLLAILELDKPLQASAGALAPVKLMSQNMPGYTVQFNKDKQPPTLNETKILGTFTMDNPKVQSYKAQPAPESVLSGSAIFNACGQVAGINMLVKEGVLYGIVIDEIAPGLQAAGVQVGVANAPCGGGGGGQAASDPPPGQAKQAPPPGPEQGKEKGAEGEKEGTLPFGLRYPKGGEWVGVAIIIAIVFAALRSGTRQQVARAFTGRREPVPAPYPYPQPAYPPQPYPQQGQMPVPPVPLPLATKPVLHGIAGKYAGASVSLETGPSLLGRDQASANLVFPPDSDSVSKRHCTVRWDAARAVFVLEDLGSTNGTFLANGERLAPNQPRDLRPGEKFYIGDMRNQFEVRMEA